MKKIAFLFGFFLLNLPAVFPQYEISLNIKGFQNDTLLFGHYWNESIMLKDTFFLDASGSATIRSEESLPQGMYTVFLPDKKRFDMMIGEDQEFSITTDNLNLISETKFKGSEQNRIFYDYLAYIEKKRAEAGVLQQRLAQVQNKQDSTAIRNELQEINEQVKNHIEGIIDNNKDLFISTFLLSMKEAEVPDPPRDEQGNIIDSSFQAKYYKEHYWDYFALSDVRMLRTPLYEKKLTTYLDRWVYPEPDSIYREVDWLIEKSRTDTLLFKYMLTTLFNYYAKSKYVGMDAVYAYIGEKYVIPEGDWFDEEFVEKLKERVQKINPLIIGKTAPDARLVKLSDDHFKAAASDTAIKRNPYAGSFFNLSDLHSKFTILYFWEADCGHCKKTIPALHQLYEDMKDKGVEVVAVSMLGGIEGKVKWVDFINEHGIYGWINAWNPYDFSYRESYDVTSSNIMYLLDENMEILAKKIGPEQAEIIIKNELKKEK